MQKGRKMTDRFGALTVVLKSDIREDDAEALMNAIRCFQNVLSVTGVVVDSRDHIAKERVRVEFAEKLRAFVWPSTE